jgi:DNA-binding transcriptional LysR family regulator
MPLNLTHLAAFHAVAETGSVTLGAERLMVSQPAVSKQVKELEKAVQTRLFDRSPRGVRPTDAGKVMADYARRIFSLAAEAEAAMADHSALRRGSLAVGASPTLGTYLLPQVLVYFRSRFPGIRVRLEVETSHVLRARLLDGSLDLGLSEAEGPWSEVEATVFGHDELVPVVHPGHPLARRRAVTPAALCAEPFVVRETGSDMQSLAERSLAAAGFAIFPVLSLASTEAVKQAVAAGLGVALVSRLAAAPDFAAGRLAVLRMKGFSVRRPVYYLRPRGSTESKAAVAFSCLLKHALRGSLPVVRNPRERQPAAPVARTERQSRRVKGTS